jgi:predicted DNA-binding protein (UPF0251 family)
MRFAPRTSRYQDREKYYDEIQDRWPRLLETWQPDKSPLQAYIVLSIRWYFHKMKHDRHLDELPDCAAIPTINLDAGFPVLDSGLTPFEAQLLRLHYVEQYTQRELAAWLGVSKSQARILIQRAHARACTLHVLRPALTKIQEVLQCYLDNGLN